LKSAAQQKVGRTARELGVVGLLLLALTWLVFGAHMRHGGFYYDDWFIASKELFHLHGPLHFLLPGSTNPGHRPLLLVYESAVHGALGLHQHAYAVFTALTATVLSLALFLTLRTIGLGRLHAGTIACLVLLSPYADSTHLWFSATDATVSITLYLLGVTVAIAGLNRNGRAALAYHLSALALFAASVLLYEVAATAIMVTGVLYWRRAGRRAALPRWAADVTVLLVLLFAFARDTEVPRLHGLSAITSHARTIYDQSLTLLAGTVFPLNASRTLILVLIALLLVGAREVSWHLPREDRIRSRLTRWIWIVLAGVALTAVAGTIFAPADPYYSPLQVGVGNRMNALLAVGLVIASYGIFMICGTLASCAVAFAGGRGRIADPRLASVVAVILALLTGLRFAHLVRVDADAYDLSSRDQLQLLDGLRASVPRVDPHETLFAFGSPAYTAPGVPVFAASWDLDGAAQIVYQDPMIDAYPVIPGSTLECAARGIHATLVGGIHISAAYGGVTLYDHLSSRTSSPRTRSECGSVIAYFTPGALSVLPAPAL
jgi:hypothetical protein